MTALVIGATREGANAAKAGAYVSPDGYLAMMPERTSPANGLQAARELLGARAAFSHLKYGCPVYTN